MRIKNRVEKAPEMSRWDQLMAAAFGRDGLDIKDEIGIASNLRLAIGLVRLNRAVGPLRDAFRRNGWKAMLCPEPSGDDGDKYFHTYASAFITTLMEAAVNAMDGDGEGLRRLVMALGKEQRPADPLGSYLLSLKAGNTKTGFLQYHFPTANEVQDHLGLLGEKTSLDTVRRRAKTLGVELKEAKRGAPPGKRSRVHRVVR